MMNTGHAAMHEHHHAGRGDRGDHGGHGEMIADFRRRFWACLLLTLPILLLTPLIAGFLGLAGVLQFPGRGYILFVLSTVVFVYGGLPFLSGALGELRNRSPGMMTLVSVAITAAYVYSSLVVFGLPGMTFFWEFATLVDIMLLGHWLEMRAVTGASGALEKLARLMPSAAHKVMRHGVLDDVPLEQLSAGDRVLVKPGEKIPADGTVIEGATSVNEAMLTGESNPVDKRAGQPVIGGSVNGEGAVTVEIKKTGRDSFLSRIIELVRQAQESKSRTQDIADRSAGWLTVIALSLSAVTLAAWLTGQNTSFAVERAVTVLVIACPHALGLAVPLVVAVSTSIAAANGFLIRDRGAFEKARQVRVVIFDKTGTLTEGKFGVSDVVALHPGIDERTVLKYAASVERFSEHPIAKAIAASSKEFYPVTGFTAIPGKGAAGTVNGTAVNVVSPGYLREKNVTVNDERLVRLQEEGKTVVFLLIDETVRGALALADRIRPESKTAVAALQARGVSCMMITGDNRRVAHRVAQELGMHDYFAEVLPAEKAYKVREVQVKEGVVAMVGDGINDAPALAQADVGIAIGAGTDVAAATADIILVRDNPLDVVAIVGLARATYRKMLQNLGWAVGYNVFALPLAAGVMYQAGILLSPALGAVLMSVSTIIVAINARFLNVEKDVWMRTG